MLEKEFKSIIDRETYERIKTAYKWDSIKEQTNTYYTDCSGILREHGIVVRARESGGIIKLQIKKHKTKDSALQISKESEFDITSVPEFIPAADAKKYTSLDVGELIMLGSLTTLRASCISFKNVEICLDKSVYFDQTDYEIEVEYTGGAPKNILSQLESLGVSFAYPALGKYSRFLKRREELKTKGTA